MSTEEQLKELGHIRNLMERSSRFISLSGLSGVFAGVFALCGAVAAYYYMYYLNGRAVISMYDYGLERVSVLSYQKFMNFFMLDAGLVLLFSIAFGIFFTSRKAKKQGLKIWDRAALRLLINLLIPLATGGVFCIIMLFHGIIGLIAPATLIFYGLALLNASKYTLNDIRYLGIMEILLGLIACFFVGHALFFWAFGFGILHIVYGVAMYLKYERS